jgi:hypothetical protein
LGTPQIAPHVAAGRARLKDLPRMKVLITGSSGQIGTNLALHLMSRGDEVVGIDRRSNTWTKRIDTRPLDLLTTPVEDLPKGPFDVVVHLAAHAKVFELVQTPSRALENVTMCFNALEYARRRQVPIIFGSSREVYGDIHRHVTEEAEADFVVAESPYSAEDRREAFIYSFASATGALPGLPLQQCVWTVRQRHRATRARPCRCSFAKSTVRSPSSFTARRRCSTSPMWTTASPA